MKTILTLLLPLLIFTNVSATSQSTTERANRFVSSSQMYLEKANMPASETAAREAVKLAETTSDARLLAKCYGNLGIALFKAEKIVGADKYLNKALMLYQRLKEAPPEALAVLHTLNKLYDVNNHDEYAELRLGEVANPEEAISKSQFYRNAQINTEKAFPGSTGPAQLSLTH